MNHPMILSAFFFNPQGDHRMSWRHPRAPGREIFDLEYYRQLAIAAENACGLLCQMAQMWLQCFQRL